MLRVVVILLVLANGVYFAWTQGLLHSLGMQPPEQAESHRLHDQLRPEAIRLLNAPPSAVPSTPAAPEAPVVATTTESSAPAAPAVPVEAARTEAPPVVPPETRRCWWAGNFNTEQTTLLRKALGMLPDLKDQWQLNPIQANGRWIVYMGRLNDELMARKKAELREMKVEYREVRVAPLSPGLALGTFSTEAAAQQGLAIVTRKGVRTARVEQERPETTVYVLRLPAITDQQRASLDLLGDALAERTLQTCD